MFPSTFVSAGTEYCTYEKHVPAPLFKKEFFITDIEDDASVIIGSKGFYEIWLNGKNITDGYLAPFTCNTEKTVYYRNYRVAPYLNIGKNTLYILLGNGFANPIGGMIWDQHKLKTRGAPAFALSFNCKDVSFGESEMVWTYSPLLFDDYRCGTFFDARITDDIICGRAEWKKPHIIKAPAGTKRLLDSEPIREVKRLIPKILPEGSLRDYRIRDVFTERLFAECDIMKPAPKSGGIIYDLCENTAGVPVVKFKNTTRGQVIHMQFTELLFEGFPDYINVDIYPDGCCQQDIYVCRGKDVEEYTPSFTYHGCRYCYVYGIDRKNVNFEFAVIRNDVKKRSDFSCSEDISCEIFKACRRSDESNLHHALTDCPAREKNGWTGDASISADHFLLGYSAAKCFASWLKTVCDFVDENGSMPYVAPTHGGVSDSVIWDSVLFFVPYYCYKYSGDIKIIKDSADAMVRNLKYHLSFRDERGIVERGMGDWLPVDKGAYDSDSPLGFCCTAVMYEMCRMGKVLFEAAGFNEYADFCKTTGKVLRKAIREEYIDGGIVTVGRTEKYVKPHYSVSQTSQAIGLFFGIFDEADKKQAVETLVKRIHDKNDSFDCGFLGLRAIFHVLSEYGYHDLAHKIITKPTHPSFANMIYRGETTVWERFVPAGHRIGSHNHHFMAEPSAWYVGDVLGIKVNPDMNDPDSIIVSPSFVKAFDYAKGYYENEHGRVEVSWERSEGKIYLNIKNRDLKVNVKPNEPCEVTISEI